MKVKVKKTIINEQVKVRKKVVRTYEYDNKTFDSYWDLLTYILSKDENYMKLKTQEVKLSNEFQNAVTKNDDIREKLRIKEREMNAKKLALADKISLIYDSQHSKLLDTVGFTPNQELWKD